MVRPKKEISRLSVNVNLDVDVLEKLEIYCEQTGRTKTTTIVRILDMFLTEYFSKQTEDK